MERKGGDPGPGSDPRAEAELEREGKLLEVARAYYIDPQNSEKKEDYQKALQAAGFQVFEATEIDRTLQNMVGRAFSLAPSESMGFAGFREGKDLVIVPLDPLLAQAGNMDTYTELLFRNSGTGSSESTRKFPRNFRYGDVVRACRLTEASPGNYRLAERGEVVVLTKEEWARKVSASEASNPLSSGPKQDGLDRQPKKAEGGLEDGDDRVRNAGTSAPEGAAAARAETTSATGMVDKLDRWESKDILVLKPEALEDGIARFIRQQTPLDIRFSELELVEKLEAGSESLRLSVTIPGPGNIGMILLGATIGVRNGQIEVSNMYVNGAIGEGSGEFRGNLNSLPQRLPAFLKESLRAEHGQGRDVQSIELINDEFRITFAPEESENIPQLPLPPVDKMNDQEWDFTKKLLSFNQVGIKEAVGRFRAAQAAGSAPRMTSVRGIYETCARCGELLEKVQPDDFFKLADRLLPELQRFASTSAGRSEEESAKLLQSRAAEFPLLFRLVDRHNKARAAEGRYSVSTLAAVRDEEIAILLEIAANRESFPAAPVPAPAPPSPSPVLSSPRPPGRAVMADVHRDRPPSRIETRDKEFPLGDEPPTVAEILAAKDPRIIISALNQFYEKGRFQDAIGALGLSPEEFDADSQLSGIREGAFSALDMARSEISRLWDTGDEAERQKFATLAREHMLTLFDRTKQLEKLAKDRRAAPAREPERPSKEELERARQVRELEAAAEILAGITPQLIVSNFDAVEADARKLQAVPEAASAGLAEIESSLRAVDKERGLELASRSPEIIGPDRIKEVLAKLLSEKLAAGDGKTTVDEGALFNTLKVEGAGAALKVSATVKGTRLKKVPLLGEQPFPFSVRIEVNIDASSGTLAASSKILEASFGAEDPAKEMLAKTLPQLSGFVRDQVERQYNRKVKTLRIQEGKLVVGFVPRPPLTPDSAEVRTLAAAIAAAKARITARLESLKKETGRSTPERFTVASAVETLIGFTREDTEQKRLQAVAAGEFILEAADRGEVDEETIRMILEYLEIINEGK